MHAYGTMFQHERSHPRIMHSANRNGNDDRGNQSSAEILHSGAASFQHFHGGPRGYDRHKKRIKKPHPIPHDMSGKVERGHSYVVHCTNAGPDQ